MKDSLAMNMTATKQGHAMLAAIILGCATCEAQTITIDDTGSFSHPYSNLPADRKWTLSPTDLGGFDASGSDKLVLAITGEKIGTSPQEVSYGGAALTQIGAEIPGGGIRVVSLYYLDNPGSGDLVVDLTGGNGVGISVLSLSGTANGFVSPRSYSTGTSTSITTTVADSLVFAAAVNNNSSGSPAQAPLTQVYSGDAGSSGHGSGYQQVSLSGTTITPTFTGAEGVMAVAFEPGGAPPPAEGFALTITPATAPDTGYDLAWESQSGKLYNVRTSTDLAGAIAGWTLVVGGEGIAATPPTNTFNVDADVARRFFAVEEFAAPPPPPLISEDFETGDGGFTVATVEGTAWERGAPDSSGLGGAVSSGNAGSANAWGTNLGTFSSAVGTPTNAEKGIYITPATTTALRTPVLDLTTAAGAQLTFAEAMDFPATDIAVVNLINATTDDIIAQVHVSTDPNINDDASWANVGPIDLAAGLGQQVRIEWRFTGTGGSTNDFLGWYIDDVLVTETTP